MRYRWLAVVAMLVASHALTITLFLAARVVLAFEVANYLAYLVVPFGALMFGIMGSAGAGYGLRWTHGVPDTALRKLLVAAAPVSFLTYLFLVAVETNWWTGGRLGVLGAFVSNITDAEYVYGRVGNDDGSLGPVGGWGIVLLGLKLAGAAAGAFVSFEGMRFRSVERTFE